MNEKPVIGLRPLSSVVAGSSARNALTTPWVFRPMGFVGVLAIYFTAQVFFRVLLSSTATLDEGEQLVFSQRFQLGYGPQPPLYTWLQIIAFQLFGCSVVGLAVLKNLLLFATYLLVFFLTRRITRHDTLSAIAAVSLVFIPQIGWESQRDLTHSVLVTAIAAASVLIFVVVAEKPNLKGYIALGVCFAAGILAKYSFAMVLAAIFIAAVTIPAYRPAVLNWRFATALLIAALLLAPHVHWAMQEIPLVTSTAGKMHIESNAAHLVVAGKAAAFLASTWFSHTVSLALVFVVLCWRELFPLRTDSANQPAVRFIVLLVIATLLIALATMVASHATVFKGRWLQPVYVLLPIPLVVLLGPRLNDRTARRLGIAASLTAIGITAGLFVRVKAADMLGRSERLNTRFDVIIASHREEFRRADIIVADGKHIGGNLRLILPQKLITTPEFPELTSIRSNADCLIVYEITRSGRVPAPLKKFLSTIRVMTDTEPHVIRDETQKPNRNGQTQFAISHGRVSP